MFNSDSVTVDGHVEFRGSEAGPPQTSLLLSRDFKTFAALSVNQSGAPAMGWVSLQ